jgi:hypothetical protein
VRPGLLSEAKSLVLVGLNSVTRHEPRSGPHLKDRSEQNPMVRLRLALEEDSVLHLGLRSVPQSELQAGPKERSERYSVVRSGLLLEANSLVLVGLDSVKQSEPRSGPHLKDRSEQNSMVRLRLASEED